MALIISSWVQMTRKGNEYQCRVATAINITLSEFCNMVRSIKFPSAVWNLWQLFVFDIGLGLILSLQPSHPHPQFTYNPRYYWPCRRKVHHCTKFHKISSRKRKYAAITKRTSVPWDRKWIHLLHNLLKTSAVPSATRCHVKIIYWRKRSVLSLPIYWKLTNQSATPQWQPSNIRINRM